MRIEVATTATRLQLLKGRNPEDAEGTCREDADERLREEERDGGERDEVQADARRTGEGERESAAARDFAEDEPRAVRTRSIFWLDADGNNGRREGKGKGRRFCCYF